MSPSSPVAARRAQKQSSQHRPQAPADGASSDSVPTSVSEQESSTVDDQSSSSSDEDDETQQPPVPASSETFQSSLPYAHVRDFAYPPNVSMHYGPPPTASAPESGTSTPSFESQMRMDELPRFGADPTHQSWTAGAWAGEGTEQLPQIAYSGDPDDHGPPYSEDEDLHSPVVVSARHRKYPGQKLSPGFDKERGYFTGVNGDGSETYYRGGGMDEMADGPGGELVTYDTDDPRHSSSVHSPDVYRRNQKRLDPMSRVSDESRYSRDYQFSIASPDEEMHGKAVALFDFVRENENELPLAEGQVIWVSYRQSKGWLVAEDPRTRESGLVPEEYVRLLRDIEGGLHSLSGDAAGAESDEMSPVVEGSEGVHLSPTIGHHRGSSSNGENKPPVISTFSTSSKDLERYPHPLRGSETGQQPPQIVHYGSENAGGPPSPDGSRKDPPLDVPEKVGDGGDGDDGGVDADEEQPSAEPEEDKEKLSVKPKKDVKRSGSNRASKDPKRETSRGKGKRSSLR